ncbi:MAG: lysophospholipid acyltransferase family protein [Desulfovibrionaceae bacterium]
MHGPDTPAIPQTNPFHLTNPYTDPVRRALFGLMSRPLARMLNLRKLAAIYDQFQERKARNTGESFEDIILDLIDVHMEFNQECLKRIPATGPAVLVCNHPFGVVDGLILYKLVSEVRADYKVMANHLMAFMPEMKDRTIEVDVFGSKEAVRSNISGMKQAMRWLRDGHLLIVFPAGEVASLRLKKRMVRDNAWSPTIAGLIRRTKATVVPACVKGKHGPLFQAVGLVHPRLRTALIPRANLKQTGRTVQVFVGNPISPAKLESLGTDKEIIDYLRFRSHLLCHREAARRRRELADERGMEPIAEPVPREQLMAELNALYEKHILIRSGKFVVFESGAQRMPGMLREIGRLREATFRPVGEGTGRSVDIDRYDDTYRHLVLFDTEAREIAGAYRFGRCDEIMARQGVRGLYSSSLFRFGPELMDRLNPALEFGRSFIAAKYQKTYQALLLLWKGIGAYMHRHPQYRSLFGCVSVSSEYSVLSREVMIQFLEQHTSSPELARLIKPTRPAKIKQLKRLDVALPESAFKDFEDIASYVDDIEVGRSIPVLLRQYLKLGGRILAFNIDPGFGDCMDGLIVVDVARTPRKLLDRFMGAKEAGEYLAHHPDALAPAAPAPTGRPQ